MIYLILSRKFPFSDFLIGETEGRLIFEHTRYLVIREENRKMFRQAYKCLQGRINVAIRTFYLASDSIIMITTVPSETIKPVHAKKNEVIYISEDIYYEISRSRSSPLSLNSKVNYLHNKTFLRSVSTQSISNFSYNRNIHFNSVCLSPSVFEITASKNFFFQILKVRPRFRKIFMQLSYHS
jgi:hypothetical protein